MALLLSPFWSPLGIADANENQQFVEILDPPGDGDYGAEGVSIGPNPTGFSDDYDIVAVRMALHDEFTLRLEMQTMSHPSWGPGYRIHFSYDGIAYRVSTTGCPWALEYAPSPDAPYEQWSYARCIDGYDRQDNTLYAFLPLNAILDRQGGPLRPGGVLEDFFGSTESHNPPLTDAVDRAPNEGTVRGIGVPFPPAVATAGFLVDAAYPVQFSNGGAGTLVYNVVIDNLRDEPMELVMTAAGVRPEWTLSYPNAVLLEPLETRRVPVLLTIPFSHEHGTTDTFDVLVVDKSNRSLTRSLGLGVYYPEVPQPAGHHPTLYLHSAPPPSSDRPPRLWVNALAKDIDPSATDEPIPAQRVVPLFEGGSVATWTPSLLPQLRMGLSILPDEPGLVSAAIVPAAPLLQATMTVELLICGPGVQEYATDDRPCGNMPGLVLATSGAQPIGGDAGEEIHFTYPMDYSGAPARIDYAEGTNLRLEFRLERTNAAGALVDGRMQLVVNESSILLPLAEYGHPLAQAYADASGHVRIESNQADTRSVNPGRTLAYTVSTINDGDTPVDIRLEHFGHNADWARWPASNTSSVGAGHRFEAPFEVSAPAHAAAGERAELFVMAKDLADGAVLDLLTVRVTVTDSEDVPDEAPEPQSEEPEPTTTPGPAGLATAVAVVIGALTRRRTRP